ncbi:MAG: coenzyme F420-0:L-glutamate ligase [Candidatus Lokiarchaeota archaeon]|nr:coenzyme F420-0:L-glutamate ligase [Candidatus Lokiarchaeota archaeon]MBD3343332.1 coenzyme F420-0:L-glutamate ligase [Candidatus Lokiarchaeota archaeon]
MQLFSIKLPIIKKNDPLIDIIISELKRKDTLHEKDIIVISEKVVATSQGRVINLSEITEVSKEAKEMAINYEMDERYVQLILRESDHLLGGLPHGHVILAQVGEILIANAGIDQSNSGGPNRVVLLPENLKQVAWDYWERLTSEFNLNDLGIIIADSRVQPLRKGTIGIALAMAGFEPIEDLRGKPDLFGRPLEITLRAIADDLTSAAQFLLNEANQQTPVVIIRNAPNITFTAEPTTNPYMAPEECLYMNIFSRYLLQKERT